MNWEAVAIIGTFTVLLGSLLFFSVRWLFKRKFRHAPPESAARRQVTPAGFVFYGLFCTLLFGGLAQHYLAPQSAFGQLVSTHAGQFGYAAVITAIGVILEKTLNRCGLVFVRRPTANE